MLCVLDASAAIEVYLNRPGSKDIHEHLRTANLVVALDLYCSEVSKT